MAVTADARAAGNRRKLLSAAVKTMRSWWFWRTALAGLAMCVLLVMGPLMTVALFAHGKELFDFRGGLYNAGVAILHGRSPYQPGFLEHQAAVLRAGGIARGETFKGAFSIPVYPAFPNLLVVPLSLPPLWLAGALYTLVSIAAMGAGLRLLGVRDWRCLALVAFSWPFLYGLYLGAIGPFLVLGAGIAWRWREHLWPPALSIAAIVAAKIFPWTLGVWLLITRRYRALALTAAAGAVVTFGAWAVIGFHGLSRYPQMLSNMSFLQEGRADSIVTVLRVAGVSSGTASVCAIIAAVAILGLAWQLSHGPDGDRRAFGLAVLAALASTPIVWDHYMVLLFVPIALCSPRFSALWLGPLIASTLWIGSTAILKDSHHVEAASPNALRGAVIYLVLQLVVGLVLCTTPDQRAAWRPGHRRLAPPSGSVT
jgi:Glycosyltransferase family 87